MLFAMKWQTWKDSLDMEGTHWYISSSLVNLNILLKPFFQRKSFSLQLSKVHP